MSDVIRMARDDDMTRYDQISFREYHFWLRICQWRMLIIYHRILDQDLNRKYKISLGILVLDAKCPSLCPLKNSCLVSRYHPQVAFGQIVLCYCQFLQAPFWSYVMPHYWGLEIVRPCLAASGLCLFKRYFGVKLYRNMFFHVYSWTNYILSNVGWTSYHLLPAQEQWNTWFQYYVIFGADPKKFLDVQNLSEDCHRPAIMIQFLRIVLSAMVSLNSHIMFLQLEI